MDKKLINIFLPAVYVFIAGCASQGGATGTAENNGESWSLPMSNTENIVQTAQVKEKKGAEGNSNGDIVNLTPLSAFSDQTGGVVSHQSNNLAENFSGSYTRLLIYSSIAAVSGDKNANIKPLPYSERWWLSRALVGKDFSINLTAKVSVGDYETTVPMATVGHQSNSEGEQWSRVLHYSKSNFPLFLVKSDGSASVPVIKISVNGTKSYTSRGAAAALQIALGVSNATTLPAPVVTKLTEQATKDKARSIDDAISKLFASGIAEEHWTDRDLRTWTISDKKIPQGVQLSFSIPSDEDDWNSNAMPVGSWVITFDYPRPSIFSDWKVCGDDSIPRCKKDRASAEKAVHAEIDASQVLNYNLLNNDKGLGTIRAFLAQQDWYLSAQSELVNQNGKSAEMSAASFCRKIKNEISGVGLNGFDADIVVWAVYRGMPLPSGTPDLANVNDCKRSIDKINANRA